MNYFSVNRLHLCKTHFFVQIFLYPSLNRYWWPCANIMTNCWCVHFDWLPVSAVSYGIPLSFELSRYILFQHFKIGSKIFFLNIERRKRRKEMLLYKVLVFKTLQSPNALNEKWSLGFGQEDWKFLGFHPCSWTHLVTHLTHVCLLKLSLPAAPHPLKSSSNKHTLLSSFQIAWRVWIFVPSFWQGSHSLLVSFSSFFTVQNQKLWINEV